jgi:pimeloyl-ACP methyl ester carboxylesterase
MTLLAAVVLVFLLILAGLALFTRRVARSVERALPPAGRYIDVPGARLHVREAGAGQPLLLIHGLAGQMGHFTYGVMDALADRYRVIAVDRPGSGYSTRDDDGSAGLQAQAAAMAALLDALGIDRAVVVGHSLGGAVALTLALDHPARVAGLALLAPLTHPPENNAVPPAFRSMRIGSPLLRKLFAWTLATPGLIVLRDRVLAEVFGPEAVPRGYAIRAGGLLSARPSQFIGASADLMALEAHLPALPSRYSALAVPVGVLYGRQDRILDWRRNGAGLAALVPGAELELVDGGHMLPVTLPQRCAEFIAAQATRAAAAYPATPTVKVAT